MRGLLLTAAALALATPAHAQSATDLPEPEQNLRCAVWAAMVLGNNQDNAQVAVGFSMAVGWFSALYEGATGKRFEDTMTPEYVTSLVPDIEAIENGCKPRMQEMGQRFSDWGAKLQEAGRQQQEAAE
ncbi:MAG TPA: hypothetical protein VNR60_04450 [Croceibacterium sp.]|nr:hypothetical protein [Croceibacterium sp.]